MKAVNVRELKRFYESDPQGCTQQLCESLDQGHIKPAQLSLRDLFESVITDGAELLRAIGPGKSGRRAMAEIAVLEAAGAVDTSAFASISGQMIFNATKEAFELDTFIGPELVTTVPTQFLRGEIIPGIGGLGDVAEHIQENADYPTVGPNEEYTKTAPLEKLGFIVPITREVIIQDRTGLLLERCSKGGEWLGLNKEKRILNVVTAGAYTGLPAPNNYNRNGTSYNTYLTSGTYINKTNVALSGSGNEWTALQSAELLFPSILDPNTNEPIAVTPDTILVPRALLRTAQRIINATGIEQVDMRVNASTVRTMSDNPYKGQFRILCNNWVNVIANSTTAWWVGQPKKAFCWMEAWGIETEQAAPNNIRQFMADIWIQHKCSMCGVAQVREPRYMVQGNS